MQGRTSVFFRAPNKLYHFKYTRLIEIKKQFLHSLSVYQTFEVNTLPNVSLYLFNVILTTTHNLTYHKVLMRYLRIEVK